MANTFTLQIATPERVVLEKEVVSLVVPAYEGYLGVKARHAPLVAEMRVGVMTLTHPDGNDDALAVSGGFLAVSGNVATVLADSAELASEIDVERARSAQQRARQRLSTPPEVRARDDIDLDRAQTALLRASNRLTIARKQP